ncbi:hypothetical protein P3S68_004468 [Capsicum galapagoense]
MKKKLCLCYCPSVVEADDDSSDVVLFPSSTEIVQTEPESKTVPSLTKPHKHPSYSRRKKFSSYKYFPRLFKAILFQDPLQLEIELKSKASWNRDEKCFKKLENHESRKPEMEVEEVTQEKVSSISHESQKLLSSNWTKPNTSITTSTSSYSCDNQKKKDSCSLLYLIVFALFMKIFLGKYWAIILTLSWLYSIPYRSQFLEQRENATKSSESRSKS